MDAPLQKEKSLAFATKLVVNSRDVGKYLDWLTRLMMVGIERGVLSAEILPPHSKESGEWVLVQRFSSPDKIEAWLKSEGRKKLLNELSPYLESKEVALSESKDSDLGSVSIAVATHVKDGREKAYFDYERRYQSAQAKMPGYHGAYVQPPKNGSVGTWVTIIRYDTQKSMNHWFNSEERKKLVAESDNLVRSTDFKNVTTSYPGWFPTEAGEGPPNWKTALLILLGLYPSVMFVIQYVMPLLQGYPMAVNNFIGNILTVSFTTWVSMPLFIKFYNAWLFPTDKTPKWVGSVSIISLLIFYALEIAFFWRYF